jgi:glycosyltransferase involved in cell wall biosynthesis
LAALPVVVTVHGLDWQRAKWGCLARNCLKFGERVAAAAASRLVVVSPVLKEYFLRRYRVDSEFIPNGVTPIPYRPAHRLVQLGIRPQQYILAAARLVPEKGLHYLVDAFRQIPHDVQLVIAGGSGCDDQYERQLRKCDDPRVVFTGAADRDLMAELFSHAKMFVLPSDLEGMPVVLLEAMSMGIPVLVSDIDVHQCFVQQAGMTFRAGDVSSLKGRLLEMLADPALHAKWSGKARKQVEPYRWADAARRLESVYQQIATGRRSRPEETGGGRQEAGDWLSIATRSK